MLSDPNVERIIDRKISEAKQIDLRDHFAGLAMQGFLAYYGNNGTWDNLSEMSYQVADSMINARKEVKP